jgi:hypothetical protein
VRVGRRVVGRPADSEELVLVLVVSYLVCRWPIQLVLLRRRSEAFKELEIAWGSKTMSAPAVQSLISSVR